MSYLSSKDLNTDREMPMCDLRDCYDEGDCDFADPGGRSALRAARKGNPRNRPCPTCRRKNVLTPADVARGYQCDRCVDTLERGW